VGEQRGDLFQAARGAKSTRGTARKSEEHYCAGCDAAITAKNDVICSPISGRSPTSCFGSPNNWLVTTLFAVNTASCCQLPQYGWIVTTEVLRMERYTPISGCSLLPVPSSDWLVTTLFAVNTASCCQVPQYGWIVTTEDLQIFMERYKVWVSHLWL
jgi:hypothetical protein